VAVSANEVGTETSRLNNFVRATLAVGKFSDGSSSSVTVNLDGSHNEVTDSESNRGASGISTFSVNSTTFLSEDAKD
jgi:hypothetical protein